MKFLLPILLVTLKCFSQHTERFQELIKLIERDSIQMDTLFSKNGNIDFVGEQSFYTFNNTVVKTSSGESKIFYASGTIARNDMQDKFGHWIWSKYYNRKGVLTKEWITTKIDTRAETLKDFFASRNHIDFERTIKHYRFSKSKNGLYAYKIEYLTLLNGMGSGKVEYLNEDGKVTRTKMLKEKNKNVW
jgi:hypothetical protein